MSRWCVAGSSVFALTRVCSSEERAALTAAPAPEEKFFVTMCTLSDFVMVSERVAPDVC